MPGTRPRVAVLASGGGTTFEAFVHASQAGVVDAEVGLLIFNNSREKVVQRWQRLNAMYRLKIVGMHISNLTHPDPEGVEVPKGAITMNASDAIAEAVEESHCELNLALGYMKRLRGPALERGWINTHPGLLPQTAGLWGPGVHEFVSAQGHAETGHTLHHMDSGYDTGAEIAHRTVPIMPFDDAESIADAVQASERVWVPRFVQDYLHA